MYESHLEFRSRDFERIYVVLFSFMTKDKEEVYQGRSQAKKKKVTILKTIVMQVSVDC